MDAIDNLIFATLQRPLQNGDLIESEFIPMTPFGGFVPVNTTPPGISTPTFNFSVANKRVYTSFADYSIIEKAMSRHWFDVDAAGTYTWPVNILVSDFRQSPNYHLMYAYLVENTRILQIFERVIERYLNDEQLGIAQQAEVVQWIINTERLFFKEANTRSYNIRSLIRPSYDANRRNAYYRLFGIDLAFGDANGGQDGTVPYQKATTANQQFIPLFERYLSEIWQGYINARNISGPNTADVNNVVELAIQLQELLAARRGGRPGGTAGVYATRNLSYEEFSSVVLLSWFAFIISDNTPVVQFLNCQSSTIGERLIKIGNKVGIPAHTKSQALFEMAGAAANILTLLEAGGYLDNNLNVQTMLSSLNPGTPISVDSDLMNAFLTVINNWEKATGHKIKNPEANITGTVRVQQPQANGTPKPKPVMN
ncbi:MAG TPA: hypothetical protein VFT06_06035 [Flavisolibacter sp.]|jgi:hypothetical protein|nr:hypothetical protein [Flavisolibacter sp.]